MACFSIRVHKKQILSIYWKPESAPDNTQRVKTAKICSVLPYIKLFTKPHIKDWFIFLSSLVFFPSSLSQRDPFSQNLLSIGSLRWLIRFAKCQHCTRREEIGFFIRLHKIYWGPLTSQHLKKVRGSKLSCPGSAEENIPQYLVIAIHFQLICQNIVRGLNRFHEAECRQL